VANFCKTETCGFAYSCHFPKSYQIGCVPTFRCLTSVSINIWAVMQPISQLKSWRRRADVMAPCSHNVAELEFRLERRGACKILDFLVAVSCFISEESISSPLHMVTYLYTSYFTPRCSSSSPYCTNKAKAVLLLSNSYSEV
jgi:hypothetical protein